jgi:uncharacterized membrane protein
MTGRDFHTIAPTFLLCFLAGAATDVLIVLYYRAIQSGAIAAAMALSFIITLVPLFVTERGIARRDRRMFLAYALGAAAGTAVGLIV